MVALLFLQTKKEDKRGDVKNNFWDVERETSGYSFFLVMAKKYGVKWWL